MLIGYECSNKNNDQRYVNYLTKKFSEKPRLKKHGYLIGKQELFGDKSLMVLKLKDLEIYVSHYDDITGSKVQIHLLEPTRHRTIISHVDDRSKFTYLPYLLKEVIKILITAGINDRHTFNGIGLVNTTLTYLFSEPNLNEYLDVNTYMEDIRLTLTHYLGVIVCPVKFTFHFETDLMYVTVGKTKPVGFVMSDPNLLFDLKEYLLTLN